MRQARRHRHGPGDVPRRCPARLLLIPGREPLLAVGERGRQGGPGLLDPAPCVGLPAVAVGRRDRPLGLIRVVEQRHQGEVVGVRERVELVRVTLRARGRQPQPCRAGGAHPIDHRQIPKLERVDSPLLVDHRVAMEAGGDDVVGRGSGEQVAGDLADREAVERHVVVECLDHPVAPRPDRAVAVFLVAVGVGIPRQIEPAAGPSLAVARARQQPIDEPLVGTGGFVGEKRVEFGGGRRQAHEVEVDPAAERGPIGLG